MKNYILKKIIIGVFTIFLSFCLTFFLIRCSPGNPIKVLAGTDNPNPELIEHLTKKYGLDKSVPIQFLNYIKNAIKGDLGYSYMSNESVSKLIGERILPTILLTLTASVFSVIIGVIFGIISAQKKGLFWDKLFCSMSYIFDSLPSFWLGLIFILVFSSTLKLLPTSGMYNIRACYTGWKYVLDVIVHMILPVATLVIIQTPIYFRVSRTSILQIMNEDFVLLLKATGMNENKVFYKYVLRNAIIPVVTIFGTNLAFMLGGATLIEIVFAWPGMGRLLMNAIVQRDYPLLTGIYLMISVSISVVMIITDLVYAFIDPRIRLR